MKQAKKGSTVVLPSDFQSETTSNPLFKGDTRHFSHGCARADARTLAPEDIIILILTKILTWVRVSTRPRTRKNNDYEHINYITEASY